MNHIRRLARQAGFHECFVLPPDKFIHYERRLKDGVLAAGGKNLCVDPRAEFPWANALLLLVYGYPPYPKDCGVSGNYPASNIAYHGVRRLIPLLEEHGVLSQRIYVPIRELALRSGLGVACKNGLTAYDGYGTRVAVQTLVASVPEVRYHPPRPPRTCPGCGACIRACPSHAITEEGYHVEKCARTYMGKETMPQWAMDAMTSLLGCEVCQFACPLNQEVAIEETVPEAFDLERLLSGQVKPALEIVGKNLNSGGRILCHAAVMAAKGGRRDLLPKLRALLSDDREQVKVAAKYAISLLQDPQLHGTIENSE